MQRRARRRMARGRARAAALGGAGAAPRGAPACGVVDVGGVDGRVSPADEHVACVRVAPHRPSGLAQGAARHKSKITVPYHAAWRFGMRTHLWHIDGFATLCAAEHAKARAGAPVQPAGSAARAG